MEAKLQENALIYEAREAKWQEEMQAVAKWQEEIEAKVEAMVEELKHLRNTDQHNTTVAYQTKALGLVLIAVPQGRRAAAGYHADQRQLHSETKRN